MPVDWQVDRICPMGGGFPMRRGHRNVNVGAAPITVTDQHEALSRHVAPLARRPRPHSGCRGDLVQIRLVLAHPTRLGRAALTTLLEDEPDIAVVGEAASGDQAVALARKTRPHVVLMNHSLLGLDGLSAIRQIRCEPELAQVEVLALTAVGGGDDAIGALLYGASGVLVDDTEPYELLRAVRVVAGGLAHLSAALVRGLIREVALLPESSHAFPDQFAELTAREREIVALVAEGFTNDEIAQRLVVSSATAKTHVSRAMAKLGIHDRAKLVALAYQTGFVRPEWRSVPAYRRSVP
jgi:DNA-binding NarL/FixJ family response regulator